MKGLSLRTPFFIAYSIDDETCNKITGLRTYRVCYARALCVDAKRFI
jgi:hypothetical protein